MIKYIALIFLIIAPTITFADIYKWTDKQGITHITDDLTNAPPEIREKHTKPIEPQIKKIQFKDGYIEVREKTNSFGFSIHYNDPNKGRDKFGGCYEETKGQIKNTCRESYEQIIKNLK